MNRLPDITLSVRRRDDKTKLPSIMTPGGKHYVISEEGLEYIVEAELGVAPYPPHGMCLGVSLSVDGSDVGYWYTIGHTGGHHIRKTATFDGFAVGVGQSTGGASYSTSYRNFQFAKANPGSDRGTQVADPEQIKAGRITAHIAWYQDMGPKYGPPQIGGNSSGSSTSLGHLPEGKKFFLAPSLKTEKGRSDRRNVNWSTTNYAKVQVVGDIELRYETASTLMLRNHLSKTNAAHRVLLRQSRDPTVQALLGHSDDEDEGTSPARPPGAARVKREGAGGAGAGGSQPRVKRERDVGSVYLDLTKAPDAPLKVDGREVGADEVAVCDLAASSDEEGDGGGGGGNGGARWEVVKRQAVEVDRAGGADDV